MIYDHKLPTCVLLQCVDRWSNSSNIKCSIVKNPTMLGNCNKSRLPKPWCFKKNIYINLVGGIPTPLNNISQVLLGWFSIPKWIGKSWKIPWFQSAPAAADWWFHTRLLEETFQAGLTWSIKMPPSPTCNLGEPIYFCGSFPMAMFNKQRVYLMLCYTNMYQYVF